MRAMIRVVSCVFVLPLILCGSAYADATVDNDCITSDWAVGSFGLSNYVQLDWTSDTAPGGSVRLPLKTSEYTWCSAEPKTTYHFTAKTCISLPDPFGDVCGSPLTWDARTKVNIINGGGFENQSSNQLSSAWIEEGTAARGVDVGLGYAHSESNNGWIRGNGKDWNAMTQVWPLGPNLDFHFTAWVRTSSNLTAGYFGIRNGKGQVVKEVHYGPIVGGYQRLVVDIHTPNQWDAYTMYIGYWGPGADAWIEVDDVWLTNADQN